jgi:hypothetical protein
MRFAGNFHPEWGYLAPAPSVMRTARIVAVATAIGATAGAAVVLSLADRPAPVIAAGAGQTLVVVHSLVQPAEAAVPVSEPVAAVTPAAAPAPVIAAAPAAPAIATKPEVKLQISAPPVQASAPSVPALAPVTADSRTIAGPTVPQGATASAENPPTLVLPPTAPSEAAAPDRAADAPAVAPDPSAAQTAALKKPHLNEHDPLRPPLAIAAAPKKKPADSGLAPILRRLFSAHTGNTRAN